MLLVGIQVHAQPADEAALLLADQDSAGTPPASRTWHVFVEAAADHSTLRQDGARLLGRVSADLRHDDDLALGWRAVLAARLDANGPKRASTRDAVATWKESYLSWRPTALQLVDAGRINVRNGVASGYNPTDYFKADALRSVVSLDPISLKENRQGSWMLRAQQLWDSGSLTALYSPRLAHPAGVAAFPPGTLATNVEHRVLLSLGQRWSERFNPQWMLFKNGAAEPQFGLDLSYLVGDATVLNLEWSGGRSRTQLQQALRQAGLGSGGREAWHNRLVASATHTASNKLSVTAELDFDGAALDARGWSGLRQGPLPLQAAYTAWVQAAQELSTRCSAFVHGSRQDAVADRIDLSGLWRRSCFERQTMIWLESRYRTLHGDEIALQYVSRTDGRPKGYDAPSARREIILVLRRYF